MDNHNDCINNQNNFAFYRTILYFFALDFKALERELRSIGIKVL